MASKSGQVRVTGKGMAARGGSCRSLLPTSDGPLFGNVRIEGGAAAGASQWWLADRATETYATSGLPQEVPE